MTLSLPLRFSRRNVATAVAAPASLFLVASRRVDADRSEVVLVGDLEGMTNAQARRHAVGVLDAMTHNEPGVAFDVELQDCDNAMLWSCTGGVA